MSCQLGYGRYTWSGYSEWMVRVCMISDIGPEGLIMALECDIILLQKLMYLKLPSESTKYLVLSLLL